MSAQAAKKVKLSKGTVIFSSPTAKAQTITIKNLKTSNVKKITIYNDWKEWMTIKKKGKNKIVIKPKRSSGDLTYGVAISIEYKKPVNGAYSEYLPFKKIKIKGSSKINIKSAKDLCNMRAGSYSIHRWKYYLTKDINMTGKGVVKNPGEWGSDVFSDIYLDGKGHSIKSNTPIFHSVGGIIKNVVFDVNMKCTVSKKDAVTKIWSKYCYNSTYGGVAPIIYNNGTLLKCKSKGSISIVYDKGLEYGGNDGTVKSTMSYANVAGLVEENCSSSAIIKQCKSEVNITFTEKNNVNPFIYVGGLVAENYGYSGNKQYGSIVESEFSGKIHIKDTNAFNYSGGIYAWGGGFVKDCLNTGSVKSDSASFPYAAGIAGTSGSKVERVFTVGDVNYGLYGNFISKESVENKYIPTFKNAYYLKSKSDGFYYLNSSEPVSVPGTKGVTDEELLKKETFKGFDFNKVWKMGTKGPELRNVCK